MPIIGGMRAALPIVLGYTGIGLAAGLIGSQAGLSVTEVGLVSLLVFAGSAQFVFAQLYLVGAVTLVPTVFLLNFRHFLYSASFAPLVRHLPLWQRTAIGAQLTDETFAIASALLKGRPLAHGSWMIALNFVSYTAWFLSTLCGALVGSRLDNLDRLGLDFALPAMFAAILMLLIRAADRLLVALLLVCCAAGLTILLDLWLPGSFTVLFAAIGAATLATLYFGVTETDRKLASGEPLTMVDPQ